MTRTARWLACLLALSACGRAPERPSLVLVTLDTLRRDHVGAYGSRAGLTPHLDRLADGGLVHESAFTTMPTTAPAHASLFTGLDPHEHGVRSNGVPLAGELQPRLLAIRLRRAGYATGAFVTTRLLGRRTSGFRGFSEHWEPPRLFGQGERAAEAALRWLDGESRRPVFLWLHVYDPHAPYGNARDRAGQHAVDPAEYGFVDRARFRDPARRRQRAALYARGVQSADAALGALLAGVRERLERPLVVVVSDHGEALDERLDTLGYAYDHGEFLDEAEVRIALILAGPGVVPGRSRAAVSIRDLYTTLLEAGGVGDAAAAAEGRRDLRERSDERRLVTVEGRRLLPGEEESFGPAAVEAIGRQRVLVSDGAERVTLGARGEPSSPPASDAALADAARRRLARLRAEPAHASPPLDPETEQALRRLGYAE